MKRQQITEGSILRISLPCGKFGYGRIVGKAGYAFYDLITSEEIDDLDRITNSPILFIVGVYNNAVNSGRWFKIGKKPLEGKFKALPMEFVIDGLNPSIFRLYNPNTGEMTNAKKEDCIGFERAAVWEAEHVEERICDHHAGIKNKWVEVMRIKD